MQCVSRNSIRVRLLICADSVAEAERIVDELRRRNVETEFRRLEQLDQPRDSLLETDWDIVISTCYAADGFSGLEVLKFIKKNSLEIPVIMFCSDTSGQHALTHLEAGAADYICKYRYARLALSVKRELRKINESCQRQDDQQKLRESEDKFRQLADSIADIFYALDRNLCVTYWNHTCEELTGLPQKAVIGKNINDIFPGFRNSMVEKAYQRTLTEGRSFTFEHDFPYKGANYIIEMHIFPYTEGLSVYARDITRKKEIENELRRRNELFRAIIDNVPVMILFYGKEGRVEFMNKALEAFLGWTTEEAKNMDFMSAVYPDPHYREYVWGYVKNATQEWQEFYQTTKSGERKESAWSDVRLSDGSFIGIGIDLTEKKRIEHELQESRRLSDIGKLSATVAHELRNPLGVIKTAAFNLRRKAVDHHLDKYVNHIDKKIGESDQIINNLLAYTRIKLPHFKPVDIVAIIRESLDSSEQTFHASDIQIEHDLERLEGVRIEADPFQLSEVFINIINNAFQSFDHHSGRITARGWKEDHTARIEIEDTGKGIAPEDIDKVFEPFFTRKSKGTGLGITISRELVRLHGGDIDIQSQP